MLNHRYFIMRLTGRPDKQILSASKHLLLILFLLPGLFGCNTVATHSALVSARLPALVPQHAFLFNEAIRHDFKVSPDGESVGWIGVQDGSLSIHVMDIASQKTEILDSGCWCNVDWWQWVGDSRHVLFSLQYRGKGGGHIYVADKDNPYEAPKNITPRAKYYAKIVGLDHTNPLTIYFAQNYPKKNAFDLYKTDIDSDVLTLVSSNDDDVAQWIVDNRGKLRARIRIEDGRQQQLETFHETDPKWRQAISWEFDESVTFLNFTPNNDGLWLLSNRRSDRIALTSLDLRTAEESLVYEHPQVDLETVFISPRSLVPKMALAVPGYPHNEVLDASIAKELVQFKSDGPQGLQIVSMDDSESIWVVKTFTDKQESYHLYDSVKNTRTLLGRSRLGSEADILVDIEPVSFSSRDGIRLNAYLARPRGVGDRPLPMVLLVHGGPWLRDSWEYDALVQFLANRGYAVLQVNYRGSTGYGRRFLTAAKGEFARKMHDDLIDSVTWAIDSGIADASNVAIVGGSYGGYAALVGLSLTPDVFACGISINGVSEYFHLEDSLPDVMPAHDKPWVSFWRTCLLPPGTTDRIAYRERRSPLEHAHRVTKPVLIAYGDSDSRIDPTQSMKMIERLQELGKPVERLELLSEGHNFNRMQSSVQLFYAIETFLARHLGGRSLSKAMVDPESS